jgi:hypothetical protein
MATKNNIFTQHYQPVIPATHATPSQYPPATTPSLNPEAGPAGAANEFLPIQEYVEPVIPPELNLHLQQTNQSFTFPSNIPLTPPTPHMNIPPVTYPTIPLPDAEIEKEMKANVYNAIRWLAEWCLRQIKEIQYKQTPHQIEE